MKNKTTLKGVRILVGITGSIAAYKIPHFVRLLIKQGAEVKVVATAPALTLVSEISLATVSKHAVLSDISNSNTWNNHVELALWADLMIIAPLSANTLAKLSYGLCDNLLTAVYLSARCPIYFAPAMDLDMWSHPTTQENIKRLQSFGYHLIPVEDGELASGLIGPGRMAEPEHMVDFLIDHHLAAKNSETLPYKTALITAGPTYERLDPVRFIGNFSTGKMGISFAKYLADHDVKVTLVLGPTKETIQHKNIEIVPVLSAQEMLEAVQKRVDDIELFVMAAAVSDYKPREYVDQKIKKTAEQDGLTLHLEKNPDILSFVGHQKKSYQTVIGFALETENEIENAEKKLHSKNADFIVLNSMNDEGAGFGSDTNKVTIISGKSSHKSLPLLSKDETAQHVIQYIQSLS